MDRPSQSPYWVQPLAAALQAGEDVDYAPGIEQLCMARGLRLESLSRAAVLAALVEDERGPGVLLTKRRDELARHAGQVALPGGERDGEDETAEQTALREAWEEVGLPEARVHVLGYLPRYPTVTGYLVTPVVGYVAEMPPLVASPAEVADIFVVPLRSILDPTRWRDRPLTYAGRQFAHRELWWGEYRIWGATAGMLQLLIPPLRAAFGIAA